MLNEARAGGSDRQIFRRYGIRESGFIRWNQKSWGLVKDPPKTSSGILTLQLDRLPRGRGDDFGLGKCRVEFTLEPFDRRVVPMDEEDCLRPDLDGVG